jgi:invasion protein IalB
MMRVRLENLAALGTAATLALLLGASCAVAQGKGGKLPTKAEQPPAPGAEQNAPVWYKLCSDVPVQEPPKPGEAPKQQKPEEMKKVTVCETQAEAHDKVTLMVIARLMVRQVAGQPKPHLMIMLPLEFALPQGALITLDTKELVRLAYTTCDHQGCYAETDIESAMFDQIKSGKNISFAGMHISGRIFNVPLSLEGFANVIAGPPMPADKYIEVQRKWGEIIKARLAELRKMQEQAAQGAQNAQPPAAASPPAPANPAKKGK